MKTSIIIGIVLSLLSSVLFGLIDAIMFLVGESSVQKLFNSISFFDKNMAELATGGLSATISIFIATGFVSLIKHRFEILENPFIDALGILLGTAIVISLYYIYAKFIKPSIKNKNRNNRNNSNNSNNSK
jgi:uncharacterized membrane protein YbaN (DUF454 family)